MIRGLLAFALLLLFTPAAMANPVAIEIEVQRSILGYEPEVFIVTLLGVVGFVLLGFIVARKLRPRVE